MAQEGGDCYIDVWRDADFRGEKVCIHGPAEYRTLTLPGGDWGDDIGSLRVGPNAFVMAYHRRDFQDELVTFGPNDEVADLGRFKLDDDIESMKVIDSLRIFDSLSYNSALAPGPPAADAGPGPVKGGRGRGRKR